MADLAHAKENDIDLHGDFDAAHWAERFVAHIRENPEIATSEGAMQAWFAGAIMTGHDVALSLTGGCCGRDRCEPHVGYLTHKMPDRA